MKVVKLNEYLLDRRALKYPSGEPSANRPPDGKACSDCSSLVDRALKWATGEPSANRPADGKAAIFRIVIVLGLLSIPPRPAAASAPPAVAIVPAAVSPFQAYLKEKRREMPGLLKGLVGWWSGDGSTLDKVSGTAAVPTGGVLYWPGKFGKAFLFNGRDTAVLLSDPDALKLAHGLTISAWISIWSNHTFLGSQLFFRGDDRGGLDPYTFAVVPAPEGKCRLQFHVEQIPVAGEENNVFIEAPVPMRKWIYVAGTLDDVTGRMRLYIDGKPAAEAVVRVRPFRDLDPTQHPSTVIGNTNSPGGCNEPFHGLLDELMVFNRGLSPGEVQVIYGAGKAVGSTPPPQSRIVFSSRIEDKPSQIWSAGSDGSGLTCVSHSIAADALPCPSPDGSQVVFSSMRAGTWQIYAVNADGSDPARLSSSSADEYGPDWSPDGCRIAFVSARGGMPEICLMDADGANVTQLTVDADGDTQPAWSPDGTRIAFVSTRDGRREIYTMNPDGSHPTRLTDDAGDNNSPAWSPDGGTIAYAHRREGIYQIWAMDSAGGHQRAITSDEFDNRSPAWSPDGKRIAFCSSRTGRAHIYLMDADGSHLTRLTTGPQMEDTPRWRERVW